MATMTMIQAIRSAMDVMLGRDDSVVVFGEDVGYFGGVFRCTDGLQAKYGGNLSVDTKKITEPFYAFLRKSHARAGVIPVSQLIAEILHSTRIAEITAVPGMVNRSWPTFGSSAGWLVIWKRRQAFH